MGSLAQLAATTQSGSMEQQQYETMMRRARTGQIGWRGSRDATLEKARLAIGVEPGATADDIRAAFKQAVKDNHPDNGGSGVDMDALKAARDMLLEHVNQETTGDGSDPCPMCGGSGSVAAGFGSEPCGTCQGKGRIHAE